MENIVWFADVFSWVLFVLLHLLNYYQFYLLEPSLTWLPFYTLYVLIQAAFVWFVITLGFNPMMVLLVTVIPSLLIWAVVKYHKRQASKVEDNT